MISLPRHQQREPVPPGCSWVCGRMFVYAYVRACVHACMRACVHVCMHVYLHGQGVQRRGRGHVQASTAVGCVGQQRNAASSCPGLRRLPTFDHCNLFV